MDAKRIIIIVGWLMVVILVVVSFAFMNNFMVDQDDLVTTTGKLKKEIGITTDEITKT